MHNTKYKISVRLGRDYNMVPVRTRSGEREGVLPGFYTRLRFRYRLLTVTIFQCLPEFCIQYFAFCISVRPQPFVLGPLPFSCAFCTKNLLKNVFDYPILFIYNI